MHIPSLCNPKIHQVICVEQFMLMSYFFSDIIIINIILTQLQLVFQRHRACRPKRVLLRPGGTS